jgi:hypothetical protein
VAALLDELVGRLRALASDWTTYTVLGSFLLYVIGYLTLRFHLTALGIGTDLTVLDERYLFTGARFLVYLAASVPNIVLVALPVVLLIWVLTKVFPFAIVLKPRSLVIAGIVFAVMMIQFVMRQCFHFTNLLLTERLPSEPAWMAKLLLDDLLMPLFFSGLVAACAVPVAILLTVRTAVSQPWLPFLRGLLAFLAGVQILLLPVNYGVLIVDKSLPRVTAIGKTPLAAGDEAWLVWEGRDGVTYLLRSQLHKRRALVTVPRAEADRTEIVAYDPILPTLFGTDPGDKP